MTIQFQFCTNCAENYNKYYARKEIYFGYLDSWVFWRGVGGYSPLVLVSYL